MATNHCVAIDERASRSLGGNERRQIWLHDGDGDGDR